MQTTQQARRPWHQAGWRWLTLCIWLVAGGVSATTYHRGSYSFDVAPAPAWVEHRDVATSWPASAPGAKGENWRYWLFDSQIDRRHGRRDIYVDRAYEADSADLIRLAGKYEINFNPDYEKLIVHRVELRRAGQWQDRLKPDAVTLARRESDFDSSDMSTGEVSALIVMDDVQPGDVVRISYTISGSNPILAGMESEKFSFNWYQPVLERHVRAWWDAGLPLDIRRSAGVPAAVISQHAEGELVSVDAANLPAVYNEDSYPNWYSATATLNISARRSWADVANWARELYPQAKPLPADLKQRIAQWKQLPGDQGIAAALRAVQEEVRYFGIELGESSHRPAEPAVTWQRRYGDCKDKARLLATILDAMGVQAYPALVSAQQGRGVHDWPASPNAFDHVIVQVRLHDATLWLDPTSTQQRDPLRALSRDTLGTALPVAPDTRDLVDIQRQPSALDHVSVEEHFVPDAQGTAVTLDLRSDFSGTVAEQLRARMHSTSREDMARSYADYYRRRYGAIEADAPQISDDARTGVLSVREHYRLDNPWSESPGRGLDVYPGALGGYLELPRVAQRKAPFALGTPVEVNYVTRISLPPGWSSRTEPDSGGWNDKAVQFDYSIAKKTGELVLTRHYRSDREVVAAADFPAHFALLRRINESLSRQLSFTSGTVSSSSDADREKRLQALLQGLMEQSDARAQ
jgi:hypothetical protein